MTLFKIYVFMQRYVQILYFFFIINLMLALRREKKRMKNCIFAGILYFKYDISTYVKCLKIYIPSSSTTIIIKNVESKWKFKNFLVLKL